MSIVAILLLALGAIGHVILWVALVNRAHGLGFNRRWVNVVTLFCVMMFAVMPWVVVAVLAGLVAPRSAVLRNSVDAAAWSYVAGCAVVCIVAGFQRLQWYLHPERHGALSSNHTRHINVANHVSEPLTAPGVATWLSRVPGNEVLSICVQEKELIIPRLSPQHDGLRIVHLSDLHMSGRIRRAYFEHVVEEANRCEPDIIAITGDLVERNECLDWIPQTFARLRAKIGVFYVLGNHDRRVDNARLKQALATADLVHLGGAWRQVMVHNAPLILAGNELPWFGPAADLGNCPERDAAGQPLRVLLAHTPDQFCWAQENDIDLMLAGHLHGGQVCLPIFGAMTSPSLQGVRYAAGTFRAGNTVLHVSRGTSSLTPIRWNCAPEVAVLNLRAKSAERTCTTS